MTRFPIRRHNSFGSRASAGNAEIYIYAPIGADYENGVTADQFRRELQEHSKARRIDVRINSGGGSPFEALAIHNLLAQHGAQVTAYIDGSALSAAALIPMAGDEIVIAENAEMMIHEARGQVWGESKDLRSFADMLDKVTDQMAGVFSARTGRKRSEVHSMMTAETWMTGQEAVDKGFADRLISNMSVAAFANPGGYRNAPPSWRAPKANRAAKKPAGRHSSYNDRMIRLARLKAD